ncbi:cell cycle control protein [Multifurca ochricompacta]|uniref:Cell cycle control protein n=1 Tax=Multifurca ochricompacta TaxID=376703 RepID=A0AAD4MAR9_9AGAM|nr:cell cycle control protein [Multifurca ochricompacta]
MTIFRRTKPSSTSTDEDPKKDKSSWKRPANTAFKQQRLKAWQPILTPKTVLPTLLIIGIIFAPIGALLIIGSNKVTEITINYSDCDQLTPASNRQAAQGNFVTVPHYNYRLRSSESGDQFSPPQYAFIAASDNTSSPQCVVQFDIPFNIPSTLLLYYKLTNFFQNHRRYVQSYDPDQLKGEHRTVNDLKNGNCKPSATRGDKIIYPCGLIANSIFNDTFSNLTLLNPPSGAPSTYNFSEKGIAWPNEAKKYAQKLAYNLSEIIPLPTGRWAGLPTFTKLYGRNDNDELLQGRYEITINMNYPVRTYSGTKSIVISTISWMGGKNPFLGWAYVAAASLFVALSITGTILYVMKPRRLGDMSLLSWNQ